MGYDRQSRAAFPENQKQCAPRRHADSPGLRFFR
jgi:hypothetical protein